ncbi:NADP-dependent oxidoreductase [Stomatohabitans albus]|uniref:NADP-dependent oxidoreductase n=1 Tax=Stomatohabitans albus TaxID=3110766 RepID=UPI00300D321D
MSDLTTCRAVRYYRYGDPDVLRVESVNPPQPLPYEALVEVAASNINNMDVMVRSGRVRVIQGAGFPKGIGFDYAGIARKVPTNWRSIRTGMRVWGIVMNPGRSGAMQSMITTHRWVIGRAPENLTLVEAAALPSAGLTAMQCLRVLKFQPGLRLLVVGGNGGIGSTVIQLARHYTDKIDAVVGHNGEVAREAGAETLFNYHDLTPADIEGQYDAILGAAELPNLHEYQHLLVPGGIMATVAPTNPPALVNSLLAEGLRIRVVTTIPRNQDLQRLTRIVEAGIIRPVISETYPVDRVIEAFTDFETASAGGKRVIVFNESLDSAELSHE